MDNKREKRLMLLVLPLIIVCMVFIWSVKPTREDSISLEAQDGIWNAVGIDFSHDVVRLLGEVEYVPEALLTPQEFAESDNISFGHPHREYQYSTSRIRVRVPDGDYVLAKVSADFSDIIYINGEQALAVGQPGNSRETTIPDTQFYAIPVTPDENGIVEIVQQASNFVHRETGGHGNLILGAPEVMTRYIIYMMWPDTMVMGCYFVLFLVHLVLYFMLRAYPQNLLFSLFCLTWFLRAGVLDMHLLRLVVPALSWEAAFRIEYLALPVSCVLLLWILHRIFPGLMQRWFLLISSCLCAAFTGIYLFADTLFMSNTLPALQMIMGAIAAYTILRGFITVRKINTEQLIVMLGAVFFVFAFVWDALHYNGVWLVPTLRISISEVAMAIFVLFAMAAMFFSTMRGVREAQQREQKLAAENAALQQVNELKDQLTSTISHEMRTPLAVMSVYSQLIVESIREGELDSRAANGLESISSEARRLADMATDLLNVSRMRESDKAKGSIHIAAVLRQAAELCRPMVEKEGNAFTTQVPDDLPPIFGNAGEITQLIWNLLSNAAANTRNGTITVGAQLSDDGKWIMLMVDDTGKGMTEEILRNAFERKYSANGDGHGIGLSICRDIARGHGGEIRIDSELGKGTAVEVTLPVSEGENNDG